MNGHWAPCRGGGGIGESGLVEREERRGDARAQLNRHVRGVWVVSGRAKVPGGERDVAARDERARWGGGGGVAVGEWTRVRDVAGDAAVARGVVEGVVVGVGDVAGALVGVAGESNGGEQSAVDANDEQ